MTCPACIAEELGGELLSHSHICGEPALDLPGLAANPDARGQAGEPRCYSPGLEHNRCQAGHPIHFDTTGRYEADTWVHCSIADVVACPHDSEQILDVRPGKHRVEP